MQTESRNLFPLLGVPNLSVTDKQLEIKFNFLKRNAMYRFFWILLTLSGCVNLGTRHESDKPTLLRAFPGDSQAPLISFQDRDETEPPVDGISHEDKSTRALLETPKGKVTLDGCEHPSGVCRQIRETARETYLYAQFATNSYNDDTKFLFDKNIDGPLEVIDDAKTGFGAQYYMIPQASGKHPICVIAYRGTDFSSVKDWYYGNLLNTQYDQGHQYFTKLRNSGRCSEQVRVVGHSLGGAIATYVSLKEQNAPAYIFNTSPRVRRQEAVKNQRMAVSQYGEILALFRHIFINAGGTYTTINCSHDKARHSMRPLAECLTKIAAVDEVSEAGPARTSLSLNGIDFVATGILKERLAK